MARAEMTSGEGKLLIRREVEQILDQVYGPEPKAKPNQAEALAEAEQWGYVRAKALMDLGDVVGHVVGNAMRVLLGIHFTGKTNGAWSMLGTPTQLQQQARCEPDLSKAKCLAGLAGALKAIIESEVQ